MNQKTFSNPILPGFYPDPTICRVDDDYYLACSTFAYFPGVPIFHSKDLIHWEQIGNILDRKEQLPLDDTEQSQGIFAPTLRYHDGTFYMITTNVSDPLGNFIVTATDPAGPWSDPYPLNTPGIDPSLFFDEDGKCYYCGTKERREGSKYFGDNEIYIQELDLNTMKLVGESYPAWHGALRGVEWPEGPHIYKLDGWYYLLISEAGTGHNHAVSIARSKSLFTPFEGNPANPIFTHRHLGYNYPIVNVGHPDIVKTQNNEWWMVCLASRPYGGYFRNLGRETFLVPFTWENGWPIINPGKGILEDTCLCPDLPEFSVPSISTCEDFDCKTLPYHFMYLRNPNMENYDLTSRTGYLKMKLDPITLSDQHSPSCVCVRQQHMSFVASTTLEYTPVADNEQAGLVLFQSQGNYLTCSMGYKDGCSSVVVTKMEKDTEEILAELSLDTLINRATITMKAEGQSMTICVTPDGETERCLIGGIDLRFLCTDRTGGFVGNCIGIYATSNGKESSTWCDFDSLEYIGK